jgi:hypothetical protein
MHVSNRYSASCNTLFTVSRDTCSAGSWILANGPALGIIFTHANIILYKAAGEEMRRCETGATLWPRNEPSLPIDLPGNVARNILDGRTQLNSGSVEILATILGALRVGESEDTFWTRFTTKKNALDCV